jgi:hypothetical protein
MKEIEFHNTGFVATELCGLDRGRDKATLSLRGGDNKSGDDLGFDVFHCEPIKEDLHGTFNYMWRLR